MRRPLRVAIFAHGSPLLINVVMGLRAGFLELGVDAHAGWPLPDGRQLTAFIANFRPDAIIEINRCRDQIVGCDVPCPHLAWMHDFQYGGERLLDRLAGSDLIYFILPPDIYGLDPDTLGHWRYLWPGVNPAIHAPATAKPRWDLSLVGHMYPPPPERLTRATLDVGGRGAGTFGALAESFFASSIGFDDIRIDTVHAFVAAHCAARGAPFDPAELNPRVVSLFDEMLLRIKDRCAVAEAMLRASNSVGFFGSPGWVLWPSFAPHYHGELVDPRDLADVYRSSRLNVNNSAWPLHFRTLDAMGCGAAVMINTVRRPDVDHLFHVDFQPDEHFIAYEGASFEETARRYLSDDRARARVGAAAARVVATKHLWRHRAEQIISDLESI